MTVYLEFREGTESEFKEGFGEYEKQIAILADHDCDIIHPQGAPPFMVQIARLRKLRWSMAGSKKFRTPIFTSGQNHVRAMHSLKAKSIFGATYFPGDINKVYAKNFEDAGFKVYSMESVPGVEFAKAQDVPSSEVYNFIKAGFARNPGSRVHIHVGFRLAHARHHRQT